MYWQWMYWQHEPMRACAMDHAPCHRGRSTLRHAEFDPERPRDHGPVSAAASTCATCLIFDAMADASLLLAKYSYKFLARAFVRVTSHKISTKCARLALVSCVQGGSLSSVNVGIEVGCCFCWMCGTYRYRLYSYGRPTRSRAPYLLLLLIIYKATESNRIYGYANTYTIQHREQLQSQRCIREDFIYESNRHVSLMCIYYLQ